MILKNEVYDIYRLLFSHFGKQNWWPCQKKDEIIIGVILTQNTNWKNVELALNKLREKKLNNLPDLIETDKTVIADLIKPSGYYNLKAERLLEISKKILSINNYLELESMGILREIILNVKGVGPESADSILLYYYQLPYFVIDAYTIRVFQRIGFFHGNTSYEYAQEFFHKNLEKNTGLYNEFHALIVAFGKNYCKKKPDCSGCFLREKCVFGNKKRDSHEGHHTES